MALDKLGAKRITDLDTDQSPQAQKCRLHFEQTRDALIRSHRWSFASARATLSQDTVDPDFEYDNQFILPDDYMALKSVYGDNNTATGNTELTFTIEGDRLLANSDTLELRYTKRVTDPTKFDALFVEVFVLKLALKCISLAGANPKMTETVGRELKEVMPKARAMDRQESSTIGRNSQRVWTDARLRSFTGSRI